jgi:uncharacterized protein YheU (UPF0270 family)
VSGEDRDASDEDAPAVTHVPVDSLSEVALRGIIESFVLREGTDYGEVERGHEQKIADVRRQLERGEARIEFDPKTESVNLVRVE